MQFRQAMVTYGGNSIQTYQSAILQQLLEMSFTSVVMIKRYTRFKTIPPAIKHFGQGKLIPAYLQIRLLKMETCLSVAVEGIFMHSMHRMALSLGNIRLQTQNLSEPVPIRPPPTVPISILPQMIIMRML